MSKVRKVGVCEDCGEKLYGDEYGPLGHRCTYDPEAERKERAYQAWKTSREWIDEYGDRPGYLIASQRAFHQGRLAGIEWAVPQWLEEFATRLQSDCLLENSTKERDQRTPPSDIPCGKKPSES